MLTVCAAVCRQDSRYIHFMTFIPNTSASSGDSDAGLEQQHICNAVFKPVFHLGSAQGKGEPSVVFVTVPCL